MVSLALAALPLPVAQALHGTAEPSVTVCGRVVNAAEWPLDGIGVTGIGRGLTNADHYPHPSTVTDADGGFALDVYTDFYRFVFEETQAREARAGAVYLPFEAPVAGHQYQAGACGAARGHDLGTVVLEAPATGFLAVQVADAIDGLPLEGADVAIRLLGTHTWGSATANATGVARVSCPLHVPVSLQIGLDRYQDAASDLACDRVSDGRSVALWRDVVHVDGVLTDAETAEDVAGAEVTVSPDTLVLVAEHPYVLSTTSDDAGTYRLALPWGDGFTGAATRGGYIPAALAVTTTPADIGAPLREDLVLSRHSVTFSGTIEDVAGLGLAAGLVFTGPAPATTTHAATADDAGAFDVLLPVGTYDLTISAPGKNERHCSVTLPHDDVASIDAHCLVLISAGHGVARGIIQDGLTMRPLGGVTIGDGSTSTISAADGTFALELPAGSHVLDVARQHFASAQYNVTLAVDEAVALGERALGRMTVPVLVQVDVPAADRSGAHVCPTYVPDQGAPVAHPCGVADAAGDVSFALQWTSIGSQYHTGSYTLTVSRTNTEPFFAAVTCVQALDIDLELLGDPVTCSTNIVQGVLTPVGPILDAHTGDPLAGVTVHTRLIDDATCGEFYVCAAETDPNGEATLLLPIGFQFEFAADRDTYTSATNITATAGDVIFNGTTLTRTAHPVLVTLQDAHTGLPVQDAMVGATAAFDCDPDVTFVCSGMTNDAGRLLLSLPHGDFVLDVASGEYDVVIDSRFDDIEQDVGFHATTLGALTVPNGAVVSGRLARVAGQPILLSVADFAGGLRPDATVFVSSERFGAFVCDPAENTLEPGFAACGAGIDASTGTVTLVLPHGTTADHTWNVTVRAGDHFREEVAGIAADDTVAVTLWPLTFDMLVDPTDVTTGETAPLMVVCILNLDEAGASPATPPPGEVCQTSGIEPEPLLFEDVTWRRTSVTDTTDRFLIRAAGTLHFPATIVASAGPAAASVSVPLVPLEPQAPAADAGVIAGRVRDADARSILAGDGGGVIGAQVFVTTTDACTVTAYEGATGLDGTFEVPVLCAGDYEVLVVDGRYTETVPQVAHVPQESPVSFVLDRVERLATITVRDATGGAPVAGAAVQVTGLDVEADQQATTGPDGTVSFVLPWGGYGVAVAAPAGGDWIIAEANLVLFVSHLTDASAAAVLASVPGIPSAPTCSSEPGPDACPASADDGAVRLVSVSASDTGGAPFDGTWLLVPPQVGAAPLTRIGAAVDPTGYAGPQAGTWAVSYLPSSLVGLSGRPAFPLSLTVTYLVGDEQATFDVALAAPIPGSAAWAAPPAVWLFNLHTAETVACSTLGAGCDGAPVLDPEAAGRVRFFVA